MSLSVFAVVLCAAALHALWNSLLKGAGDKVLSAVLVTGGAALLAASFLPFVPLPHPDSWPWLVVSVGLQTLYFTLLAQTYRRADMGRTYPLMRGTAPLLVAASGMIWGGETLSLPGWLGIGGLCAGVLSLAWYPARGEALSRQGAGVGLALLTAVVIAAYTLVDGFGVRLSGSAVSYTLWLSLLTGVPMVGWALVTRRQSLWRALRQTPALPLVGGAGTLVSYGLALWAMTVAPVAVVAALRETSIVFALLLAALLLKERTGLRRIIAGGLICAGAVLLRLA